MIGIGNVWKVVTGRDADARQPMAVSTVPRDLLSFQAPPPEVPWEDGDAEPSETRSAERFVPLRTATMLSTADGRRLPARIINISRTGVAIEADFAAASPPEVVMVGTRPVAPGRRIALGTVFMFRKPLDPKLCNPRIVL